MAQRHRSLGWLARAGVALGLAVCTHAAIAAPQCDAPAQLNDGWQVEASPAAADFDAERLCTVLHNLADGDINFHSLLVVRHGHLVTEVYRAGKDERIKDLFRTTRTFGPSTVHDVRSISKSVTSLLWGIAQAQGKMPSLDTPALSLFPDLADLNGQGREAITLAQMLSMSSGLAWNEWNATGLLDNDEFGLIWRGAQAHYVFDSPMAASPGAQFNYNGGNTAVLAQLLVERVGMSLPDYARKHLFEPLGITDWEWVDDFRGRPMAHAGLRLRPRDLARIGQLVLQHGQWQGRQIVPAEWIAESTRPHIDTGIEPGLQYGYQWWLGKVEAGGEQQDWVGGIGRGGQRLWIVPGLDMVVVATAGDYNQRAIWKQTETLFSQVMATVQPAPPAASAAR
ncbi:beta-lactamase family protein [Ralstonia pickettii]|jgi:CubicO group peptidase (beta-lactamase class C family)|uniref:serine hydrolase domain-containing protein n=1 Tax=Ralstonia insidiosa TaxID=190721 RepID=UPI000664AF7B|nr:serine hydrolase [Ralstonia insidiosa]KMW46822.1 beta-lactamase [Ralstonia sp. MD27]MBX3771191.1 beta-lactamase family protein [Ralstonia pickettii]NOZ98632.1 serine hydrolase [Betaproteobacteria bacterium]MBA9855563.1 serine hydrolase [Ralstonia insidiosa]MBA9911845.1 serine hydrolase [Ralstonia insidiosa]